MMPALSMSKGRTAFTLIELMVVVVLIGILSAVIIPEMRGTFEEAMLRSTSRDLLNAFSIASSRAVSRNQMHRVRLDTKSGKYVIEKRVRENVQGDEFAPLKDVSEAEGKLDSRISIEVRNEDEAPTGASEGSAASENEKRRSIESISFNSDGTADAAVLLLRDRQGFRLGLRINPITSRVKIVELERANETVACHKSAQRGFFAGRSDRGDCHFEHRAGRAGAWNYDSVEFQQGVGIANSGGHVRGGVD